MKITPAIIAISFAIVAQPVLAENDRIRKAIESGKVTNSFLDTLTHDDVPDQWRERVEAEERGKYLIRNFFRGDKKVLTVMWSKDWVDDEAKKFTAMIFDGDTPIGRFARTGDDSTGILQADAEEGYNQVVSLKDDGTVLIFITHEDGYLEGIEVKGRESNLMDDLDYTKSAISMQNIVKPLMKSLTEQLDPAEHRDKSHSDGDEATKAKQGGGDPPATAPEPSDDDNEKAKSEAEGRPK